MTPTVILQTLATIQGEGISIGEPILLLRTHGCNLDCSFCDTSWANKHTTDSFKRFEKGIHEETPYVIDDTNLPDFVNHIQKRFFNKYDIRRIVFSGGEPLLRTTFINKIIDYFEESKREITFEIETNGILLPILYDNGTLPLNRKEFQDKIQLNISPKIIEYGDKYDHLFLIIMKELDQFLDQKPNLFFYKFVHCTEYENTINNFISELDTKAQIVMSPLTPQHNTINFFEKYRKSCLDTLGFCIENGYRYTPREHIFLFGENRNEFDW